MTVQRPQSDSSRHCPSLSAYLLIILVISCLHLKSNSIPSLCLNAINRTEHKMQELQSSSLGASEFSFTIAVAGATYLGFRCFTKPNHVSKTTNRGRDSDVFTRMNLVKFLDAYKYFIASGGLCHCAFTLIRPLGLLQICPNPENLNPSLFSWNPQTFLMMLFLYAGGVMRIVTYNQLGKNFTYELARPSSLKTDGLYKYVSRSFRMCTQTRPTGQLYK